MAASVQCRPQERTLGMVMNEVDKNLALFLEMRNRKNEMNDLHHTDSSDEFDDSTDTRCDSSSQILNPISPSAIDNTPSDNCLILEDDKNDYDWLLTPLDTPLCSFVETEQPKSLDEHTVISSGSNSTVAISPPLTTTTIQPSAIGKKRPSSAGAKKSINSRPPTPTGRASLPAMVKPTRASTPTSRTVIPSTKPVAPVRSSTPTRLPVKSSAPVTSKSRSATPTRIKSTAPLKTAPKNPVPSRGISPTVKPRPIKPLEKPDMTKRPSSASKVRPSGAPNARSDTSLNGKPRQQSCSPSRGRVSNEKTRNGGTGLLSRSQGYNSDDVNPALVGTKMVERVVNMRKLVPPKQEDRLHNETSSRKFSTTQENSGFGRSLSKKSLDMAIRHMDITRSINCDRRQSSAGATSMNVRSSSTKSRSGSVVTSN